MSTEKGRGRPALGDVDLSDMPGPVIPPSPEEVERRRAFASSLETPAFLEHSANAGVVKVVRQRTSNEPLERPLPEGITAPTTGRESRRPEPDIAQERRPRAEEPNLTVRLPEYVQQSVRLRAVSERTTVRLIILRALRGAGFEIDDSDMTDDRGIVAKMRTRKRSG
jgi:hypothetical protein